MTRQEMTSLQRVLTSLSHQQPDRVPFFLLFTGHGARELGTTVEDYFSRPENVVEGQLRLRAKYRHDCLYNFFYAPVEIEAWGGEVLYSETGPPNSGKPFIHDDKDINALEVPDVHHTPCLKKVLDSARMLKHEVGDEAPIIGVVMSPFSLPVMQMGFGRYLELIYERPDQFDQLMRVNEAFCIAWANAQLAAGATAICYFDPVSSPTITPPALYRRTGFAIARRTLARINGPTATHMASGRCLPIIDDLVETGTSIIGASTDEQISDLKAACGNRLTVLGNLNGIAMRKWTPKEAAATVSDVLSQAGTSGGFILSDNHGELPYSVSEEVLLAISETVHASKQPPSATGTTG